MGGPFSFLIGIGSLLASGCMALKEDAELEAENREGRSHKYSYYIQDDYDRNITRMDLTYDFNKIKAVIRSDYPGMSDTWVYKITKTALAKKMMEEETNWEYRVPEQIQNAGIDLERYSLDTFKRESEKE